MELEQRDQSSTLTLIDIFNRPYDNYFQCLRDIELYNLQKNNSDTMTGSIVLHDKNSFNQRCAIAVHLLPDINLCFPVGDISHKRINEDGSCEIVLGFMGLYGVDSPLPHYWLEQILRNSESAKSLHSFFDIFNQRIYLLLYFAWKKCQPVVLLEQGDLGYLDYLRAISGNALCDTDTLEFAFVGILGQRVHNACTLKGMLKDYLQDVTVNILQFVPCWVRVDATGYFGCNKSSDLRLGDNVLLGERVYVATDKITIILGPVVSDYAEKLLEDTLGLEKLHRLIDKYLGPDYHYTLQLKVIINKSLLILGKDKMRLGQLAWMGEGRGVECMVRL
jgi:type VI secretion system protein ImpH